MVASLKEKVTRYVLLGLIVGFFLVPVVAVYFFDSRFFLPKRTASVLLIFFR